MKYFFLICFWVSIIPIGFGQKLLKTGEWCAHRGGQPFLLVSSGTDFRSDSVDIQHTLLDINITDFTNKRITGHAGITIKPKVSGVSTLRLDLLNMTIDSVLLPGTALTWTYDNKEIVVAFGNILDTNLTYILDIYYSGKPIQDASGWGGFYWQSGYAYNLGVGFAADPHNYGRAWFPCFDNFVERSRFTVNITSAGDKKAFSNGMRTAEILLPNGEKRTTWELQEPIPSYLACVAVGPFVSFEKTVPGENGDIPVQIAVAAVDTNKLKGSFLHLPEAIAAFEYWYGPYRWNKIGYSIVPFNSGAMEHATNIAYMRAAVDGTVNSETLMAHELSHHWWGDMATCSTPEDMWLNEGWASYSEHLFLEKVYGYDRYIKTVQDNFLNVLENTHLMEGGYRAVSGVPHDLTYGDHVYHKGAVVAHSLRGYMEDTLFRTGLRSLMDDTQFTDFSSTGLNEKMSAATGIDLTAFFDNWVFSPGFVDFTIDSLRTTFDDLFMEYTTDVYIKQRLRGAPAFYNNVPLEVTFYGDINSQVYKKAIVSGEQTKVSFTFDDNAGASPFVAHLNTRQRILQARAVTEKEITATGTTSFAPAKMDINTEALGNFNPHFRVEYHYAMPDTAGIATTPDMTLTNRFWVVEAETGTGFNGTMTVFYDGRGQMDQLDRELFAATGNLEDSIRLMYRPGVGHPWKEHTNYIKNTLGNTMDKWGFLRANNIVTGEYTIAKAAGLVSAVTEINDLPLVSCSVSPNPSSGKITVNTTEDLENLWIVNAQGELVLQQSGSNKNVEAGSLPAGVYYLVIFTKNGETGNCSFAIY